MYSLVLPSHLITIPSGVLPVDAIHGSPVMLNNFHMGGASSGNMDTSVSGAGFEEFGGIDPSMDPELAMAIRMSTEEARAREEARVSV